MAALQPREHRRGSKIATLLEAGSQLIHRRANAIIRRPRAIRRHPRRHGRLEALAVVIREIGRVAVDAAAAGLGDGGGGN